MDSGTIRVLHVITGLGTGGAEMMLVKLLSARQQGGIEGAVVSLTGQGGIVGPRLNELGIAVEALEMRRSPLSLFRLSRLLSVTQRFRPHLIQGWMYHGNLAASAAGALTSSPIPILWNIRQTLYRLSDERRLTQAVIRVSAAFSRRPAAILYNSRLGAAQHEAIGYDCTKRVVIPNGFDCDQFRPSAEARRDVRQELGLAPDTMLIGLIARYHPMKGHGVFLTAASLLAREHAGLRFVLVGRGVTAGQPALARSLEELRLRDRVFLLGERSDVPRITAALDVACSSSVWSEGFSNAMGEAMACGVPCVATDIGESREILGNTGVIAPANDPAALAQGIGRIVAERVEQRRARGLHARARVEQMFSLGRVAEQYHELYRDRVRSFRR